MLKLCIPPDLLELGYITGAYGVFGWLKIKPYTSDSQVLLTCRQWWLQKKTITKPINHWTQISVLECKKHNDLLLAKFAQVKTRDGKASAESLQGFVVAVSRTNFPSLIDEYYWCDLIGLSAVNLANEYLGQVVGLLNNGAHTVLRLSMSTVLSANISAAVSQKIKPSEEKLVPFVAKYVHTVDLASKKIFLDWDLDY